MATSNSVEVFRVDFSFFKRCEYSCIKRKKHLDFLSQNTYFTFSKQLFVNQKQTPLLFPFIELKPGLLQLLMV